MRQMTTTKVNEPHLYRQDLLNLPTQYNLVLEICHSSQKSGTIETFFLPKNHLLLLEIFSCFFKRTSLFKCFKVEDCVFPFFFTYTNIFYAVSSDRLSCTELVCCMWTVLCAIARTIEKVLCFVVAYLVRCQRIFKVWDFLAINCR